MITDLKERQRAHEEQERLSELKKAQEMESLRIVLGTDDGKRVLAKILSQCGLFKNDFTGNSETFYRAGRRSIGIEIRDDVMGISPDLFYELMREHDKL